MPTADSCRKLIVPKLQATGWNSAQHSIVERCRIVSELGVLQAEAQTLKRLQAETPAEPATLLPAILDKAFKGEV